MTKEPEDVLARLEALEDEQAILQTLHRFAHYIDYGLEKEWVDLFTEDGVFETHRRQGMPPIMRSGRAELARVIAGHTRAPGHFHKHLLWEPVITRNGETASVDSYFATLEEREGGPYVKTYGRYRDTLVKQGHTWRIKHRLCEVDVRTPEYVFSGQDAGTSHKPT